jgi:cold shock CspA family protein
MYDFAILIIDKHEDIAKDLISQCYQTREFHGWNISPSLKFHLKFLQINNFAKVNFKILQKKVIKLTNMHHGEIKMFNQEQNFGFIKMSNGTDIYFKGDKKNSKEYKENRKVFFDIDYDIKKNKNRAKNLFFSD